MLDQERSAPCHGTIIEQHWAAGKNGSRVGAVDMTVCRERGFGGEGDSEVERSAELPVAAPLGEAWHRLAEVERWPE